MKPRDDAGQLRAVAGLPGGGCPGVLFRFRAGTEGPASQSAAMMTATSQLITEVYLCFIITELIPIL